MKIKLPFKENEKAFIVEASELGEELDEELFKKKKEIGQEESASAIETLLMLHQQLPRTMESQ